MGPIVCDVLSTMCEKIGISPILSTVQMTMESSKIPLQQKAVLQWMKSLLIDFGACFLDVNVIVAYLLKPQALKSTNPDVKNASTAILSELHHQVYHLHSYHHLFFIFSSSFLHIFVIVTFSWDLLL